MRASFDLRLQLGEAESMELALAAYRANLSIIDFVKQTLTTAVKTKPTEARIVAPEAAPAIAPHPIAEPRAIEPPEPPAIEPRAPVAADPVPAAQEPPAPPTPAPKETKSRKPRTPSIAKVGIPRGFYRILELAEKINTGRNQIIAQSGSSRGHAYVMGMSGWYKANGFGDIDNSTRFQLSTLGRDAAAVRHWFRTLPPGTYDDKTIPYTVMRDWQKFIKKNNGIPPVEEEGASDPQPGATSAVESKAAPETGDGDTTFYFRPGGGIEQRSLSAITAVPSAAALRKSTVELEPELAKEPTKYDNFKMINFDHLNSYDARRLRQFTEKMVNLVGSDKDALAKVTEAEVSLAIRKIRGNESGDNPPTAHALARMGVLPAASIHLLRPEYIARFDDVRKWADV